MKESVNYNTAPHWFIFFKEKIPFSNRRMVLSFVYDPCIISCGGDSLERKINIASEHLYSS